MRRKKGITKRVVSLYLMAVMVCALFAVVTQAAPKGYAFQYKKVSVTMNGQATALIKAAGKPTSKTESKSCAFKGMDRTYTYTDFKIMTYSNTKKGTEYVNGIELLTAEVSTDEAIKIGSTKNEMIKAYGKSEAEFGVYTYVKGPCKLMIEVDDDDKVIAIKYLTK